MHPEVIGIGAKCAKGLFEADFDFESISVEGDDPEWNNVSIGGHEDQSTTERVFHENESDELTYGAPEEVYGVVAEHDFCLSIDWAWGGNEAVLFNPKVSKADLISVEPWPTRPRFRDFRRWVIGHSVAPDACKEVVSFFQKWADNFPTCIVRVSDQNNGSIQKRSNTQK